MENSEKIRVHYDGEGSEIKQHLMPSSLVASSIKAFDELYSEAIKEANKVYKSNLEGSIYVQGGFEKGSLEWLQRLITRQNEEQTDFSGLPIHKRVKEAVAKTIAILSRIDQDVPEIVVNQTPNGFSVRVNDSDEPTDELVCALLTNRKIRKALNDLSKPLKTDGIDTLTIDSCSQSFEPIVIDQSSAKNLIQSKSHVSLIEEGEIEGLYRVEDLSYNPSSTWKFVSTEKPSDTFTATITDDVFWSNVKANKEKFAHDDIMRVEGAWKKERKSLTGKPRTTYVVTCIEHYQASDGDAQWKLL